LKDGKRKKISRSEYFKAFYPKEIQGKNWRAISWTTAASLVSVIEMVANGKLPKKGFLKKKFLTTNF
jgi:saccharopine dehydrogenase-like NADP-dependent oxidoreductase